ncbi:lipocalin-like domain-containing protein [Planktotalea sp.]|uniref:lipocalin-like domain-containing protein n=1 Tax=Planktotalea sp. TaxID=2029877 RepID=UPI003D6AF690
MKWLIFFIALPFSVSAQGFANLGSNADGFAVPEPGNEFTFPRDHGPHPNFRIEWWYLTANLSAADGTPYGLQWTLFRSALAPIEKEGLESPQFWMGHAAVTSQGEHFFSERLARGGIGQAGVETDGGFDAWIDEWYMRGGTDFNALALYAAGSEFSFDMDLLAKGPLVLQGNSGYSVKSEEGQASYYYSQPFFDITGVLSLPDGEVAVSGEAWLDREWSSQPLASDQSGWDWFSLAFDDGSRMMGFVLRSQTDAPFTSATWIDPNGHSEPMPNSAFQARAMANTNVAGRSIPTTWELKLPQKNVDVTVRALNPQTWMNTSVPYWEGPIVITGTHGGRGYLEMTGY